MARAAHDIVWRNCTTHDFGKPDVFASHTLCEKLQPLATAVLAVEIFMSHVAFGLLK